VDFSRFFTNLSSDYVTFQGNANKVNPFYDFQCDLRMVDNFCYDITNQCFDDTTKKVFKHNQFFPKRVCFFQT